MSSNSSANSSSTWRPSFAAFWQKWIRILVEYYILPGMIAAYFGIHIWYTIYFYAWRRLLWACSQPDSKMIDYTAHRCEPRKAVALLTAEGILTLLVVVRIEFFFVSKHHTPKITPIEMQSAIPELGVPTESSSRRKG